MTTSKSTGPTRAIGAIVAGPVQLVIPAEPALSRVARLTASGLASLTGFTIDDIEDIKIAVSEVMVALVESSSGAPVSLDLAVSEDAFVVTGRTAVDAFDPDGADRELSRMVFDEVCSEHGMRFADGHAEIWATLHRTA
jgi:hypothetical protein